MKAKQPTQINRWNLKQLTVPQLKKLCKINEIRRYSKLRKRELIIALEEFGIIFDLAA